LSEHGLDGLPEAPFPNDGWSGATLTQVRRGDDAFVIKRTSWAQDWIARATRDHALREGFVAGGQLPLPAPFRSPYLGAARDDTAVAMLMPLLADPSRVDEAIEGLAPALAKLSWSATHTTFSPNVCHGGVKTNVIPDAVDVEVDIRTVPGDNEDEVRRHLDKALGGLAEEVEVEKLFSKPASTSPTGTPLWHVLGRVVDAHYPGAKLLPKMIVGFTDAPYFREKGAVAYGFGLFSRTLTAEAMSGRFHGNDERIDVESLALTTQAWLEVCEQFLA
jgi:acetylornithine deacetylase/succinyl-diaminopimelate desuccinylase-like protein